MNRKNTTFILLVVVFLSNFSQFAKAQPRTLGTGSSVEGRVAKSALALIANLKGSTRNEDLVTIPFTLKNNSTEDIEISLDQGNKIDGLAATDNAGEWRYIQNFRSMDLPAQMLMGGGMATQVTLKPGGSTACSVDYDLAILGRVAGKKVFGVMSGRIVRTGSDVLAFSEPFKIPQALLDLPWTDLGEQTYFSVSPDVSKSEIQGDYLIIPIAIANVSNQELVAATNNIAFCRPGEESRNKALRPWDYLKVSTPILKPGETGNSTGRDYIVLSDLKQRGYKPGEKITAVIGGRIPNTNKIFECYSAPFELPALPK